MGYSRLLSVSVAHRYFADNRCRHLRFIELGTTHNKLVNAKLMVKYRDDGLDMFLEDSPANWMQLESLANQKRSYRNVVEGEPIGDYRDIVDPFCVHFAAQSLDANFTLYSEALASRLPTERGKALSLMNAVVEPDKEGDVLPLHAGDVVDKTALVDVQQWLSNDRIETSSPHGIALLLRLEINPALFRTIKQRHDQGLTALHFTAQLAATASLWVYHFMGRFDQFLLEVVDRSRSDKSVTVDESAVGDEEPLFESVADGYEDALQRKVMLFRSTKKLPLLERSNYSFQLKDARTNKVIIKRLPVASPAHLQGTLKGGVYAAESNIYVNY
jgi:hypothetical protein